MPALSVIVTTYNKPRDLERVLEGLRHQTVGDFEVLVCDDGSGPETAELVKRFADSVDFSVQHCWQEDTGFRAARSRNNGGRAASGATVVYIDGDCVATRNFLEVHRDAQRPGCFMAAERYLLPEDTSNSITVDMIREGTCFDLAPASEIKRVKSIRFKNRFYRWSGLKPNRPRLMTSNCSVPLEQLQAVNGLDERYEGWGQEDEDLRRRLVMRGYEPRSLLGEANVLHLWHAADKTFHGTRQASPNWAYYERGFQLSRCRHGLVERPLSQVASAIRSTDAELAERARTTLGLAAPAHPLELEVLLDTGDGQVPRPSGDAEITVLVASAAPEPERVRGVHLVLAPGVEVTGGELPTDDHPPVPTALAKVGVRATRPVPAGLGPDSLEAARMVLDRVL